MSMYVLQVETGKEIEIKGCLTDIGIEAYVPQEMITIRSGGHWVTRLRVVMSSYVFVAIDLVAKDYYRIRQISGIIRFLELNGGASAALTKDEEKFILACCSGGRPLAISKVKIIDDQCVPIDGPIKFYTDEGLPIRYDRHRRRAVVFEFNSMAANREIWLSFEIVKQKP